MPQYFLLNFMFANNIIIHPNIQNRGMDPFTMQKAGIFFSTFANEHFKFDGQIESILIYDGKENSPRHSYASGWLYSQTADELEQLGALPKAIGTIEFEYGGNLITPKIRVTRI